MKEHCMTEDLDNLITLYDEEGNERLYKILFSFDSKDLNKSYVLVYPAEEEGEELNIEAYAYEEGEDGEGSLLPIESEEEWDMVEEVFNTFVQDPNLNQ
ncbi:DUF1292 domain-containing protein [Aerococcus tenax]|uniref:DUF1292 domain-containing protein n=1 Tax=Aerococcus tenax TaxID=3078812 RepID=UPI00227D7D54|nr:DUF1292 domain-containing protein [Aerococcus tenax]